MSKAFNVVGGILVLLMLGSLYLAFAHSENLRDLPKVPDVATGHVIPMTMKGIGTVYMDQKEWDRIAPYWDGFYVFVGLLLALIFGRICVEGYRAFMKGWHSTES